MERESKFWFYGLSIFLSLRLSIISIPAAATIATNGMSGALILKFVQ